MRRRIVEGVLGSRARDANLAVLVAAAAGAYVTVPYTKAARYDGRSRVGLVGLAREAVASLRVARAASRASR
jgi:hypothetical protein